MFTAIRNFALSLFFSPLLFILIGVNVAIFLTAFFFPALLPMGQVALLILGLFVLIDLYILYVGGGKLASHREVPDKFSNGDENPVHVHIHNQYRFGIRVLVIDELPHQFQIRNHQASFSIPSGKKETWSYNLRPVERGEYEFGSINLFVSSPIGLIRRRYREGDTQMVPTYPSYVQMRQYQLMAISNRLTEVGVKQIRRLGHTTEFEQIKEYVQGDDYRTINWKATARSQKLMVNQYADERAQHVYCLIDKSRAMKMPFEGMTLMDYAINASLVMSNIALYKSDKAGLISFAEEVDTSLPASNRPNQMHRILEVLYNQETAFLEADYERLYTFLKRRLSSRSLLLLFTNFESLSALKRQLPYLQAINRSHLLMVIFFENTELKGLLEQEANELEDIYVKTIGEDFSFQKKRIAKELEKHGILSLLTSPSQLTVDTLNRYLEIKSRGMG